MSRLDPGFRQIDIDPLVKLVFFLIQLERMLESFLEDFHVHVEAV